MRRLAALLLLVLALGFGAVVAPLIAQDDLSPTMSDQEQKDWLARLLQDKLSTPERQIRISNIDGVLHEIATIREITISDSEGVWLRINNASINWDVTQVFIGRIFIRSLTAESIEYIRNPVASPTAMPSPEAPNFTVPELPVAVIIDQLSVPSVTFGESVFGLGSQIAVAGSVHLEGGSLDTNIDIKRLDGPGGELAAKVAYQNATSAIDLDVKLTEPPNGILANLLHIEGKPAVGLSVTGSGPITSFAAQMALDAGGTRALSGGATIGEQPEGFAITADLRGPIGTLVDPLYKPFFGAETGLSAKALVRSAGGLTIESLTMSGGQLTLQAAADTTADGFLRRLALDARIADPAGERVLLPLPGATTVESASIKVDYGTAANDAWSANIAMTGFGTEALTAEALTLGISGAAMNIEDPAKRRVTFNGDGMLTGIFAPDKAAQAALGSEIGFGIAGLWEAGKPVQLAQLRLAGKALEASLSGTISDLVFNGGIQLNTSSIAPFSGLAGRELAGGLTLSTDGSVNVLTGGFDLTLDGTGSNLRVAEPTVDGLLRGDVRLTGRVARDEQGLTAENFRVANQQVQIAANGTYATGAADFRFTADVKDLSLLSAEAQGPLSIVGTAKGEGAIALDLAAKVPQGRLVGHRLSDAAVGFKGTATPDGMLVGSLSGDAFLDGFRVTLGGDVATTATDRRLTGLRFSAGPTVLSGDVAQEASGLTTGRLQLASNDVSIAAALLLLDAKGAINADIGLSVDGTKQNATVKGSVSGLSAAGVAVGSADVTVTVADLYGVPRIDGAVAGRNIDAFGVAVDTLDARASRNGETTTINAQAALENGTALAASGSLTPLASGYRLAVDTATLTQGALNARLAQPAALVIDGDTVSLDAVRFDVGGGRVTATGTAGQNLDVTLALQSLPLSVANAVAPGLGLAGTIDGTARITGTASKPAATFTLNGAGIEAAAISGVGIAPLYFTADGSFADGAVRLRTLTGQGAGGLRFSGSGTVPLNGGAIDVAISGSAPLALANRFVADRGGQLSGNLSFDVAVRGTVSSPRATGSVAIRNGGYVDPDLKLRVIDIAGNATLSGDRIQIGTLTGALATGGRVAVAGGIGLGAGFPADLSVRLDQARYADGNLFVATVSGDLRLSGPVLASPTLSGNLAIEKADITVPENFGGGAAMIEVRHIDPPRKVTTTLARAATVDSGGAPVPQSRPSVLQLDVALTAPNQIFIRGRGLDVEVGGSVQLRGPVTSIQPVGAFHLIRGRLSILGKRLTFDRGEVTLIGDLDPYLDLAATVEGDDLTASVRVSGRASDIQVDFSSEPSLPQDEVISRLLFGRSIAELSPLQIARLAAAAAELAGGGSGGGLVDSLRERAGLADLDIVTDQNGNVGLRAGRYIQDNIYLGVEAGANGTGRVTVNLDLTDNIKARAAASSTGESDLGVFYEKDY